MNYDEMSDFEINQKVAWTLGCNTLPAIDGDIDVFIVPCDDPQIFDPCNNPSDAWPIIVENRIGIIHAAKTDKVLAQDASGNFQTSIESGSGLRCAMLVFLKMKESE